MDIPALYETLSQLTYRGLLGVVSFLGILCFSFIVSLFLRRLGRRKGIQENRVYRIINGSQKTVLIIIAIITLLGTLGVNVSALVAGLGLTGFAFGIALKDAISNLVSGILIIVYRTVSIGDEVEIMGAKGAVKDLNLRYVTIGNDEQEILIPNSSFLSNKLIKNKLTNSNPE
jgi:small-conductance mechanosensitive channel